MKSKFELLSDTLPCSLFSKSYEELKNLIEIRIMNEVESNTSVPVDMTLWFELRNNIIQDSLGNVADNYEFKT